jgi:hypothetical protein
MAPHPDPGHEPTRPALLVPDVTSEAFVDEVLAEIRHLRVVACLPSGHDDQLLIVLLENHLLGVAAECFAQGLTAGQVPQVDVSPHAEIAAALRSFLSRWAALDRLSEIPAPPEAHGFLKALTRPDVRYLRDAPTTATSILMLLRFLQRRPDWGRRRT